ncbi:hypothetical protein B1B_15433 [mine drainage metagenome]|uniref:Polymer-forming cytoskeletal n=1 Tax=mine drainage metagenome TaxID=410659 RepID=T0YUJ8_9ZZZZ
MDKDLRKKLIERLEQGAITAELYEEILKRWNSTDYKEKERTGQKESEDKKNDDHDKKERGSSVKVMGSGQFDDVYARELSISGSGRITGNVDVINMEISGAATVDGNAMVSEDLEVSGSLKIEGDAVAKNLDLSGSLKARSLESKIVDASGSLSIVQGVNAEEIEISGMGKMSTLTCVKLDSSGKIASGMIKAESIDIDGIIDSDEIECKAIRIDLSSNRGRIGKLNCNSVKISRQWRRFHSSSIRIDEITCITADLEGVIATKIVGDDITLGGGCDVDYVEAKTLKLSENAVVRKKNVSGE